MKAAMSVVCALLVISGVGVGLSAAYAEGGDGCKTYVRMYPVPPVYHCKANQCIYQGQACALSTNGPYGASCDCNGVWQYPSCDTSIVVDQVKGWYVYCQVVLCSNPCVEEEEGIFDVYCKCQ